MKILKRNELIVNMKMDVDDSKEILEYHSLSNNGNATSAFAASANDTGGFQPGAEAIIVPVIFSFMIVLGGIGNLLVIIVVIINKDHFKNTTNLFILNLAAADLLFLVFCVPFHAVIYTSPAWPFGQFMCKFVHLVQYASMIASILTLVAMSFDRYLAVGFPLRTKHMRTPYKALGIVVGVWLLSLIMAVPWPIFFTIRVYRNLGPEEVVICADDWGGVGASRSTYFLFLFLLGYAVPLVAISILSTLMVRQLWIVDGYRCHGTRTIESIKAKRKVTRLVIVIVVVFLVCWLPSHIIWLWTNYFSSSWHHTYRYYSMRIFAHVLSYANSAMNPVIYAFLSQNFRNGFKRALCCKKRNIILRTSPFPSRSYSRSQERALPLSSFATYTCH